MLVEALCPRCSLAEVDTTLQYRTQEGWVSPPSVRTHPKDIRSLFRKRTINSMIIGT